MNLDNHMSINVVSEHEYRLETDARMNFVLAKEKLQKISSWNDLSQLPNPFRFYLTEPNGNLIDTFPAEGDLVAMGERDQAMDESRSWFMIDKVKESNNSHLDEYQLIMRSTTPPGAPRNVTNESTPFSIVLRRAGERVSVQMDVSDPLRHSYASGDQTADRFEELKTRLQSIADDLINA